MMNIAKKYCLVTLTLAAFANAGMAPAFAAVHHRATQHHATRRSRQLHMYAPANACAAPALATVHQRATQPSQQLYMYAPANAGMASPNLSPKPLSKEEQTSAARNAALQECNAKAVKVGSLRDWTTAQAAVYGNCMAEHGQRS